MRLIDGDGGGDGALPMEVGASGLRSIPQTVPSPRRIPNRSAFGELRHVVHTEVPLDSIEDRFFSAHSERIIADVVTERLDEEFPDKRFYLKKELVRDIMSSIFSTSQPSEIGSIGTRGTVALQGKDYVGELLDKTTNALITTIANEQNMIQNNEKLSAWDAVLGESNRHGLRAHPKVKINHRRPEQRISMRY